MASFSQLSSPTNPPDNEQGNGRRPARFARLSARKWEFARQMALLGSPVAAARAVGLVRAHERLTNDPLVREAIAYWLERKAMSAPEVRARLADIARGDIGEFLDESGNVDLQAARKKGLTRLIKRIRITEQGDKRVTEIELYDALQALLALAKAYGMLVERTETTHRVMVYIPDNGRRPGEEVIDV